MVPSGSLWFLMVPCGSLVVRIFLLLCGSEIFEFLYYKPFCYIPRVLICIWILSLCFLLPCQHWSDNRYIALAMILDKHQHRRNRMQSCDCYCTNVTCSSVVPVRRNKHSHGNVNYDHGIKIRSITSKTYLHRTTICMKLTLYDSLCSNSDMIEKQAVMMLLMMNPVPYTQWSGGVWRRDTTLTPDPSPYMQNESPQGCCEGQVKVRLSYEWRVYLVGFGVRRNDTPLKVRPLSGEAMRFALVMWLTA